MREKISITKTEWENLNTSNDLYPGGEKARNAKIAKLRGKYADNPKALLNIDRFDPNSDYFKKLVELRDARNAGDTKKITELTVWFQRRENV